MITVINKILSGVKGEAFCTAIRLPQCSVISPLLFSLFIADWYENVKSKKVKFADDGTIWISRNDWKGIIESLKVDFKEMLKWARKWRLILSIVKREFSMFSLDNQVLEEARKYNFDFEGQIVKYDPKPKIIAVTLDEKLKFETHVENGGMESIEIIELIEKSERNRDH